MCIDFIVQCEIHFAFHVEMFCGWIVCLECRVYSEAEIWSDYFVCITQVCLYLFKIKKIVRQVLLITDMSIMMKTNEWQGLGLSIVWMPLKESFHEYRSLCIIVFEMPDNFAFSFRLQYTLQNLKIQEVNHSKLRSIIYTVINSWQ